MWWRSEARRIPRWWVCVWRAFVSSLVLFAIAPAAHAQFKVIGPPPFPAPEARKKIKAALEQVNPDNSQQTLATLSDWLKWYRDILDEELIAAWKKDDRDKIIEL